MADKTVRNRGAISNAEWNWHIPFKDDDYLCALPRVASRTRQPLGFEAQSLWDWLAAADWVRDWTLREPNLDWLRRGIKLGVMFKIRWTSKAGRSDSMYEPMVA
jgi:hypothetical protein